MISACERCSLWEEAVNVLCMLLASSIFHAFSMPIASSFFTVITVYKWGVAQKALLVFSIAGWRRIQMAGVMW